MNVIDISEFMKVRYERGEAVSDLLMSVCLAMSLEALQEQKNAPCTLTDEEIIALWDAPFGTVIMPMSDEFVKRSEELMDKGLIKDVRKKEE